jgi:hypothetical protein
MRNPKQTRWNPCTQVLRLKPQKSTFLSHSKFVPQAGLILAKL